MTTKTLTVREKLADNMQVLQRAEGKRVFKDAAEDKRGSVCMKSYYQGEIAGLVEAERLIEKELRRLKSAFQNGHLSLSDFDVY